MKKTTKVIIVIVLVFAIAGVAMVRNSQKTAVIPQAEVKKSIISTTNLPRLVDLGADKCIPCKMMAPVLEDLKNKYNGKLIVDFVDVWKNPDEAKKSKISVIPTQIFYDASGKELFRHEGFFSENDIIAKWNELGVDLNKIK